MMGRPREVLLLNRQCRFWKEGVRFVIVVPFVCIVDRCGKDVDAC